MSAHNIGCVDPNCHACRAASEGLEIAALWRARNGRDTFMGIVQLPTAEGPPTELFKLDDPKGDLEGPGHVMMDEEFLTECAHYDNPPSGVEFMYLPLLNRNCFCPMKKRDEGVFRRNHAVGVLTFGDKPEDFTDSEDDDFDVKFPTQVRAGDMVKVVAAGITFVHEHPAPFMERFWIHVTSVTSFGIITGQTGNTLHSCDISPETGYLAFHFSAVLGVCHGEHWDTEEDGKVDNKEGEKEGDKQEETQGDN